MALGGLANGSKGASTQNKGRRNGIIGDVTIGNDVMIIGDSGMQKALEYEKMQ